MAGTFMAPNFERWERCVVGVLEGRRRHFKRSDCIVVPRQRRPEADALRPKRPPRFTIAGDAETIIAVVVPAAAEVGWGTGGL